VGHPMRHRHLHQLNVRRKQLIRALSVVSHKNGGRIESTVRLAENENYAFCDLLNGVVIERDFPKSFGELNP